MASSPPTFVGYSDSDTFEGGAPTGTAETMMLACPAHEVRLVVAGASSSPTTGEVVAMNGASQEVDRVTVQLPTAFTEVRLVGPDIQAIDYALQDPGTFVLDDVRLVPEPSQVALAVWALAVIAALRVGFVPRRR